MGRIGALQELANSFQRRCRYLGNLTAFIAFLVSGAARQTGDRRAGSVTIADLGKWAYQPAGVSAKATTAGLPDALLDDLCRSVHDAREAWCAYSE
jgi:hypothetical protein